MRLRSVPGAEEMLLSHPDLVVPPGVKTAGRWHELLPGREMLELEIGCGRGLFITALAAAVPEGRYVGMEVQKSVLCDAVGRCQGKALSNLRFIWQDAANLAELFAPGEIKQIYLNFPDPWPKSRHAKRRLTHKNFLCLYEQVLVTGGRLRLKTDNLSLYEYSLQELQENHWTMEKAEKDCLPDGFFTEYERRFRQKGLSIHCLTAVKPIRKG